MSNSITFVNIVIVASIVYVLFLSAVGLLKGVFIVFLVPVLIIALLLGLTLLLPKRIKLKFAISIVSIALTMIALETSLEIIGRIEPKIPYKTIPEHVQDIRNQNISAYPTINVGSSFESFPRHIFPLAGISNTFSVFCSTRNGIVTYISDEHGFNNPKNIWTQPSTQLVSVGDSFTHGECVNSSDNSSAELRTKYPNSLNLGWAGTGPLAQYAVIREYVEPIRPEIVLWFYYEGNDLTDLTLEQTKFPILKQYLSDTSFTQNLIRNQLNIDRQLKNYVDYHMSNLPQLKQAQYEAAAEEAKFLSGLKDVVTFRNLGRKVHHSVTLMRSDSNPPIPTVTDQTVTTFSQLLKTSSQDISSWNGRLFFVYLPSYSRYSETASFNRYDDDGLYHSKVISEVTKLAIPTIDISEAFDAHPDPLSLWPDRMNGHYNETGYSLVAKTVIAALEHP